MDFICLCVRILKSGSYSLRELLIPAFADQNTFYLPDTLNLDGRISTFQKWRFRKARIKNLLSHYRTVRLSDALDIINARAANGDLIAGGHIDFPTARKNIGKKLKIITIFRNPFVRCASEYNYMRHNYNKRSVLTRFDSKLLPKIAGKYDFCGYLDFLLEHADVYGNIACTYVGWDGQERIIDFFTKNVFHSGILEESEKFTRGLSEKLDKKFFFPHENRTLKTEEEIQFRAEERRKIERLYNRDLELYEWQRQNV